MKEEVYYLIMMFLVLVKMGMWVLVSAIQMSAVFPFVVMVGMVGVIVYGNFKRIVDGE